MSATPTFFINGQLLAGAQPLGAFKAVIDAEVAAKGATSTKIAEAPAADGGAGMIHPPVMRSEVQVNRGRGQQRERLD